MSLYRDVGGEKSTESLRDPWGEAFCNVQRAMPASSWRQCSFKELMDVRTSAMHIAKSHCGFIQTRLSVALRQVHKVGDTMIDHDGESLTSGCHHLQSFLRNYKRVFPKY